MNVEVLENVLRPTTWQREASAGESSDRKTALSFECQALDAKLCDIPDIAFIMAF